MDQLVVALGLLPAVNRPEANIDCPACGRKDKLNINFRRQIFACPACGVSGGIMDAWALFRGIDTASKKENRRLAKIDMVKFFGEDNKSLPPKRKQPYEKPKELYLAPIENRDRFYRRLIEVSPLLDEHREALRKRGLNDAQIAQGMFFSAKNFSRQEIDKYFWDIPFEGIPGCYIKDGKKHINCFGSGIMIPEPDVSGMIQGLVFRTDKVCKNRYLTYSSEKKGGTKGRTFTSFVNYYNKEVDEIILTEGPLKGAVINFLTETPVIAIPGVTSQKYLKGELRRLKEKGLKKVIICYDMDYKTNENVQKGLSNLRKKLSDLEIRFIQRDWNERYKGYDDYLISDEYRKKHGKETV